MLKFSVTVVFLLAALPAQASPIYVITESDGSIRFTTREPGQGAGKVEVFTARKGGFSRYSSIRLHKLYRKKYDSIIQSEASRAGVDPSLVKAVIHVESGFNARARSRKGALGLMQLMPDTARLYGVKNPFEPRQNIRGGVRYLAYLSKKYNDNLRLTLAAYNAGPEAVEQYNGIPPYRETQNYVRKVLGLFRKYRIEGS